MLVVYVANRMHEQATNSSSCRDSLSLLPPAASSSGCTDDSCHVADTVGVCFGFGVH